MRYNSLFMPLALVSAMAVAQTAHAESFTVSDIRVNGLVRLTPVSVYNMLPIATGDNVDADKVAEAVRALHATGQFDDIKVQQVNNSLMFDVVERPIIGNIELDGNKMIPKEALLDGLKKMGISSGAVVNPAVLQNLQNELEQQYIQQGRYNAKVSVETIARAGNRVDIKVKFIEGKPARVVDINVIGNTVFKPADIQRAFALKESNWTSIVTRNDRYAREKMAASLENLRAMYLNDGYVNFNINHSKLDLSEDKQRIFVEVSIDEGKQFKYGQTQFLGDTLFKSEELASLQGFKSGQTYSQAQVDSLRQQIIRKYGNIGYYFAEVNIVPQINEERQTVDLAYYVNPGQKINVRRINFTGNTKTADHVLRREMRQMENAPASVEKIELSKIRLERTGHFKSVDMRTTRVPNAPDLIDIDVKVEEQASGTSSIAVGYSQGAGVTYSLGLSQANFLGTGNSVAIDLSRSDSLDNYNINVLDPYYTVDGVSRGFNGYYRKTKLSEKHNVSNYVTDSVGGSLTYGYPIDENQSVSATLNVDQTKVTTGSYVSTYVRDYLLANKGKALSQSQVCTISGRSPRDCPQNKLKTYDSSFDGDFRTYNLNLAWAYNTLNRPVFPTSGTSHRVGLEAALPGSDVQYQKLSYDAQAYFPLWKDFVLRGYGKLGYGNKLPFYKNFFAGGGGSLRGYEINSLGPKYPAIHYNARGAEDPKLETVGGNALVQGGLEIVLPMPSKSDWARQMRPVIFVEGAQVFDTDCKNSTGNIFVNGKNTDAKQYCKDNFSFSAKNMRYSAGVGMTWITMIGPLSISYSFPLNKKPGDDTKNFQFEIGRVF
ncbi:outer membrane protein assembly factor BamA [Acinetobacter sp. c3-l95]|uniref:outer membrane protein assembly factor BamA n=1 Tax=Acinetobacter sp. c3-l95 TaxID=3342804 RepID=UPI0035B9F4F0